MNLLLWLGLICGVCGTLLSVTSVAARLTGAFWLGGFQVGTLLQAGVAGIVAGCFCLLVVLVLRKS